ncbi:MAG: serine/threonine protein phosphatase [Syntrophobacterales bacterium]|nr:serine/threonine protein phosphatase [Syntrophobacterales bacterium]
MSIYVVGDIHGCLGHLERLLEEVNPDLSRDRLVFVGDYIDRGLCSRGVVEYLVRLKARHPGDRIICLKGNHEAMFLDFLTGKDRELFLFNGGRSTLREYWGENWQNLKELRLPPEHEIFFRELLPYYETPEYFFVHAGVKPGVPLDQQSEEDLLWIRGEFIMSFEDFGKKIVFGHTPFRAPLIMPNKLGIDTGAVYGNFLTCVKLPEEEFFFAGEF